MFINKYTSSLDYMFIIELKKRYIINNIIILPYVIKTNPVYTSEHRQMNLYNCHVIRQMGSRD